MFTAVYRLSLSCGQPAKKKDFVVKLEFQMENLSFKISALRRVSERAPRCVDRNLVHITQINNSNTTNRHNSTGRRLVGVYQTQPNYDYRDNTQSNVGQQLAVRRLSNSDFR